MSGHYTQKLIVNALRKEFILEYIMIMSPILPRDVLNTIHMLNNQFRDSPRDHRPRRHEFVPSPNFKATTAFKNTEGVEASIDNIRERINKISATTYDKLCGEILEHLDTMIAEYEADDVDKIVDSLFVLVKNNKFYADIYARLYKEFVNRHGLFKEKLYEQVSKYEEAMVNLKICADDDDYDKQCKINAENDRQKAMTTFLVMAVKYDLIEPEYAFTIIHRMTAQISSMKDIDTTIKINDELAEHIFIVVVGSIELAKKYDHTQDILDAIKTISDIPRGACRGISTRCKYKMMDVVDILTGKRPIPK